MANNLNMIVVNFSDKAIATEETQRHSVTVMAIEGHDRTPSVALPGRTTTIGEGRQ